MKTILINICALKQATKIWYRNKSSNKFITLPIFYVNGDPHIGHLYTAVVGDAFNRWEILKNSSNKLSGSLDRLFTGGTDEHGTKIELAALLANQSLEDYTNFYSNKFKQLFTEFNISTTHFIRTTDERHKQAVKHFWIAKETKSIVQFTQEENYMFKLSDYLEDVKSWLIKSDIIYPKSYLPIALQLLKSDDFLSISRDATRCKWGISVPGNSKQTIYVWLDALINYLTVCGYPFNLSKMWPPDIQIIGKDILKFHAVYWPAFLMAANLPLPKKIFVHGHWTVNKMKMSKSLGNVVDPFNVSKQLTNEGLRYFLLKQGVQSDDSNFNLIKAINVINSDLVNNLGNLTQRSTSISLNPNQEYPIFDESILQNIIDDIGKNLVTELNTLLDHVSCHYDSLLFYKGLELIVECLKKVNAFFHQNEPWKKSQGPELSSILYITYEASRICNILLQPIVPLYAAKSLTRLGITENCRNINDARFGAGFNKKNSVVKFENSAVPIMKRINSLNE